jgi:hypothetical protein
MLIGIARILYSFWSPLLYALNGCDFPEFAFRTQAARLLVSAPVVLGLTYAFGLIGTVVGFVVAHAVPLIGGIYYGRQVFPDLSFPRGLSHQVVAGLAMALALFGLGHVVPVTSNLVLGATLLTGAAVYVGVLLVRSVEIREGLTLTVRELVPSR